MTTKKYTLLENMEWFWIKFVQGFYDFRSNFKIWKGFIFKHQGLKPDLQYIIFWMYLSGEEIIIEAIPYKERKNDD